MGKKRPYEAKKIKKSMDGKWKYIKKGIEKGVAPSKGSVEELLDDFDAYLPYVEESWSNAWDECAVTVKECLEASFNGDLKKAKSLLSIIKKQKKVCHKKYK
jgi:XXXCH domain-containing protein